MWMILHGSCVKSVSLRTKYLCKLCTRNFINNYQSQQLPYTLRSSVKCGLNIAYPSRRNLFTSLRQHAEIKTSTPSTASSKKPTKSDIKRLLRLMNPEKWNLAGAICLLFVSSAVTMAVPFALGRIIDVIYTKDPKKMRENLNKLCISLAVIFTVGALCNFGRVYLMNLSGQRITKSLRENVFKSIISQETAFFDKHKTGELINRLSADTSLVSQSVTMNISDGLRSSIMVVAGVSMMFYMSPKLAIVGLSIVPPIAALAIFYGRFVRKITKNVQDTLADATNVAEERISNIRTVKSFSQEAAEVNRYASKIQAVFELAKRESLARGIFFGMTGFSGNVIILSVLYYGGILVSDDNLTVGSLSSFLLYAAYIGVSMGGVSSFYSEMNRGLGASARLWELLDRVPQIPVSGGIIPHGEIHGNIIFSNVVFSYPSRPEVAVLDSLNLKLSEGSITAVVGASGSGKSTLAALLLRLYDPLSGDVILNGQSIRQYDPRWLRKSIGTVSQEPVLFSGTIRDNIVYGLNDPESVTDDDVIAAAREANALHFIESFPEKFNTVVGEKGVMLSGGQKQRIAIARALIKNPKFLLFDEATSALDAESEHLVQEALQRILKGRTVLTIAHRLSTIKSADQIAVIENGKIADVGSYNQLITKDGPFKNLIRHQTMFS